MNQTNERGFETQFNSVNATSLLLNRTRRWLVSESVDNFYVQTEASYALNALGMKHKLVGGFEFGNNSDAPIISTAPMTATSVLAPVRGITGTFTTNQWSSTCTWVEEYFLQDQVFLLNDKVSLLAGARYAMIRDYNANKQTNAKSNTRSEAPNPRLNDLANTNVRNPDPDRPGYQIQTGEERTKGIEFDFVGRPLPGWQVIGSTNVSKTIISRNTGATQGNRRANSPSHTYSLWNRYQFGKGVFEGWSGGPGFVRFSGRFGDVANSYYIPDYHRFDAALSYRARKWDLALNVQNLTDESYIRAANGRLSIRPGSPRDFSLRFRWRPDPASRERPIGRGHAGNHAGTCNRVPRPISKGQSDGGRWALP